MFKGQGEPSKWRDKGTPGEEGHQRGILHVGGVTLACTAGAPMSESSVGV